MLSIFGERERPNGSKLIWAPMRVKKLNRDDAKIKLYTTAEVGVTTSYRHRNVLCRHERDSARYNAMALMAVLGRGAVSALVR